MECNNFRSLASGGTLCGEKKTILTAVLQIFFFFSPLVKNQEVPCTLKEMQELSGHTMFSNLQICFQ